jgi:hypothetical protein
MSTHRTAAGDSYQGRFEAVLPWSPAVLVGTGIVVGLLIWFLVVPVGRPPAPADPSGLESVESLPTPPPAAPGPASAGLAAPDPTTEPAAPPHPSPPGVAGSYELVSSFGDEFIGKVVIVNGSHQAQDWVVELAFMPDVDDPRAFWVDGEPHPAVHRSGSRYEVTGAVPVSGESTVILRLNLERAGPEIDPITCTVNASPCT